MERTKIQTEIDLVTSEQTERLLLQSRSKLNEHSDKSGKILAQQIRQYSTANTIPSIRRDDGRITKDESEINSVFEQFYTALYSSELDFNPSELDSFFNSIQMPQIPSDNNTELEKILNLEELNVALSNMQNSKAPGPDGFTVEFFTTFKSKLMPLLLAVLEESFSIGCLPQSFYQATISVLPKKGKDLLNCS